MRRSQSHAVPLSDPPPSWAAGARDRFPWTLPLVRDPGTLAYTARITFLAGENGCGKSTLLDGIAAGMNAVAAGGHDLKRDPLGSRHTTSQRTSCSSAIPMPVRAWFLRAENVFGYTGRLVSEMRRLRE